MLFALCALCFEIIHIDPLHFKHPSSYLPHTSYSRNSKLGKLPHFSGRIYRTHKLYPLRIKNSWMEPPHYNPGVSAEIGGAGRSGSGILYGTVDLGRGYKLTGALRGDTRQKLSGVGIGISKTF